MENELHITDNAEKLKDIFDNKYEEKKEKEKAEKLIQIGVVIDLTGSMSPFIQACKAGVTDLIEKNKKSKEHTIEVSIAGYRDKKDTVPIVKREFFRNKVDWEGFNPDGGADLPEDLLIGLKSSLGFSWKDNALCKLMIILTDAPTHGSRYHANIRDDYPQDDQLKFNLEYYIKCVAEKNINLFLINITEHTEIMNQIIRDTYYQHMKELKLNLMCSITEKSEFSLDNQKKLNDWFVSFVDKVINYSKDLVEDEPVTEPEPEEEVPIVEVKKKREHARKTFTISVDGNEHTDFAFNLLINEFMGLNPENRLLAVHIFNDKEDEKYSFKNKKETICGNYETKEHTIKNMKFIAENKKGDAHVLNQVNKVAAMIGSDYLFCGYNCMKGPRGDKKELSKGIDFLLSNSATNTMVIKENIPRRNDKGGYNWMFVLDKGYSVNCVKALKDFLPLVDNERDFVFGYILLPTYDSYDDISKVFIEELEKIDVRNFEMETAEYSSSPSKMIIEKINYGDKPFEFVIFYNRPDKHIREKASSDVVNIVTNCMCNVGFVNQ